MPLTDSVPSSAFDVLERNIKDTDKFANQETGTFTNRVGKEIKPIPVIEAEANAAVISLGWHQVGLFADGFTYLLQNDIAKDAAGDWYRWNGALPKVVTAGTLPSSDVNFVKIDYKSHADLSDRNPADGSAHNADDIGKAGGGSVQDFIDSIANPDMGAAMVARGVVAVDSIADLLTLPEGQRKEGLRYMVASYSGGWAVETPYKGPRGGGEFIYDPSRIGDNNGGTVLDGFVRVFNGIDLEADWFGPISAGNVLAAFAAVDDGMSLSFPSDADFELTTGNVPLLAGKNNVTVNGRGAKITHPLVYTGVLGVGTSKVLLFKNCSSLTVENFDLTGKHLEVASGVDNTKQVGIQFIGCSDSRVHRVKSKLFSTCFWLLQCSSSQIKYSKADLCRSGFTISGASTGCSVYRCEAKNARFEPTGTNNDKKTAGYGFLSDGSTYTTFEKSTARGCSSNDFRIQNSTGDYSGCEILYCKSYQSAREAVAVRGGTQGVNIVGHKAYAVGDLTFWNGDEYLEPYQAVVCGALFSSNSSDISMSDSVFYVTSSGTPNDYGVFSDGIVNGLTLRNNKIRVAKGTGIRITAVDFEVTGNNIRVDTRDTSSLGIVMRPGSADGEIRGNSCVGGRDGIRSDASEVLISENRVRDSGRYGISQHGSSGVILNNIVKRSGLDTIGVGYYIEGDDCYIGPNSYADDPDTPTADHVVWIAGTGTISAGPIQGIGVNTVRRSVDLSEDAMPVYGKAAALPDNEAKDLAGLNADLNALKLSLRNASLMQS